MKLRILLATVALLSTLCSACSSGKRCVADAFADIAVSYAIAGQKEQALQVAQTMDNSALKAEALSEIALKYVEAGQQDEATQLFTQALQIANNKIEQPADKAVVLEEIAVNYGKARQKAKAAEILSHALQVAQTIEGNSGKDTVVERIAVRYAEIGEYNQGIQVAETIWDDIPKGRALSRITVEYVKSGAYDQARQVADTIEAKASKANALTEIAAKTGEYKQAIGAAQNIEDENAELRSIVLGKIVLLYIKAGQKKQAVELLSQVLQAAKQIENTERRVDQLAKVALWYADMGENRASFRGIFSGTSGYSPNQGYCKPCPIYG